MTLAEAVRPLADFTVITAVPTLFAVILPVEETEATEETEDTEEPETEDKEEVHAALLDVLYEMAEEHPKNMMKLAQKVKNYLEK